MGLVGKFFSWVWSWTWKSLKLFYSLKTISRPFRKIGEVWKLWHQEAPEDPRYKRMAFVGAVAWTFGLILYSVVPAWPAIWTVTYPLNYYSVLPPSDVSITHEDKELTLTNTVIEMIETLLENWQPDDLWVSPTRTPIIGMDDPTNFQLEAMETLQQVVNEMWRTTSRRTEQDHMNKNLEEARMALSFRPDSWWLPSSKGEYLRGLKHLKKFREEVKSGAWAIQPLAHNLDSMINLFASNLSGTSQTLASAYGKSETFTTPSKGVEVEQIKHEETPYIEVDDNYFRAQGQLWVVKNVLVALSVDFEDIIGVKQAENVIAKAIDDIASSPMYLHVPIWVLNLPPTMFGGQNMSMQLGTVVQTARTNLDLLQRQI